jgi:steroid 5-alpha reductase family enzyme
MDVQNIATMAMCVLFLIYGCRLGGYLLIREIKSASYRNTMKKEIKDGKDIKMVAKVSIWVSCAFLYALQVSPLLFRLTDTERTLANAAYDVVIGGPDPVALAGAVIMALGIILESTADWQKSKQKSVNPNRFCDKGLYKIVRCPNYLGEVLFWTGVFVSGVNIYANAWQWIAAATGYICIVYIMFGGARRLELRQNRNYGEDPEYQAYVKKTPILLLLVPLYSVAKYKWLVG